MDSTTFRSVLSFVALRQRICSLVDKCLPIMMAHISPIALVTIVPIGSLKRRAWNAWRETLTSRKREARGAMKSKAILIMLLTMSAWTLGWAQSKQRSNRSPVSQPPAEAPAGFDNKSNGVVDDPTHQADQAKFDEVEGVADGLGPLYNAQSCRIGGSAGHWITSRHWKIRCSVSGHSFSPTSQPNQVPKIVELIWLSDKGPGLLVAAGRHGRFLAVCGRENDFYVGPNPSQFHEDLRAAHSR